MRKTMIALAAATVALPAVTSAPAMAQYRHHDRDRDRHYDRDRHHDRQRFNNWSRARAYDWNRYEPGYNAYYADRYYRMGNYRERRLSRYDRIYRGRDGRYYCRRNDGTTGLIVGGAIGALLGNQLRIGGSETLSTILGGAAGAAIGQSIARGNLRCR